MIESLKILLEKTLVPVLKVGLDPLHAFLDGLPPAVWRISVCLFILMGTVWTFFLSKESVYRGLDSRSRLLDLRIWVGVIVLPYLLIYMFL